MPRCFQELELVLERHGYQADGLLEVLAEAQRLHGCLSEDLLRHVAQVLRLPLSRVQGTASFYHLFRLRPPAPHACLVCTGTACHVRGAGQLLEELRQQMDQEAVELGSVRCVGTCGGAPLVVVDGEIWNHQTTASVLQKVRRLTS